MCVCVDFGGKVSGLKRKGSKQGDGEVYRMRTKEGTKQYNRKETKTADNEDIENKQKEVVHF